MNRYQLADTYLLLGCSSILKVFQTNMCCPFYNRIEIFSLG